MVHRGYGFYIEERTAHKLMGEIYMDERSLEASEKMDELSGGLYFVSDRPDHHDVYDVRKAAAFFRELGLKPGDQLPEEYMEQCLFKEGADA